MSHTAGIDGGARPKRRGEGGAAHRSGKELVHRAAFECRLTGGRVRRRALAAMSRQVAGPPAEGAVVWSPSESEPL